jgi:light-regulated signal transduction histidine kinase (bacteriophytochrome)
MVFEFSPAYARALTDHVVEGSERTLAHAQELGEEALETGLDSSAVVVAHLESLRASGLLEQGEAGTKASARRQQFLLAALQPFSIVRHRYEHANEELACANETLLERTRELEAVNTELEAFNFSVSHDLRTSLQAILGFSQTLLARHRHELGPEAARFLDLIVESTRGMGELIEDLLGFSQANRAPLEYEPVDIAALARSAISELEPQLEERKLEVVYGSLPVVRGDRILLKRVLVNLLSNAIKFTRGGQEARVEIGSFQQDGERVIFVRDNGVGFDMELSDRLYRVFERLHRGDEFEGTGIGLALVERIVVRHGGRIWAESVRGEGASFYFTLEPAEVVSATPERAADSVESS